MNDGEKKYDLSVVIPCYDEGRSIDRTLVRIAALVAQLNKDVRVAVFVVINNARWAEQAIIENNRRTRQFLAEINARKWGAQIRKRSRRDENILKFLAKSWVDFIMEDMFEWKKAPEICNVWIARKRGLWVASWMTDQKGIIIWTDADTLPSRNYIDEALKFRHDERYGAATWPVDEYDNQSELSELIFIAREIELMWLDAIWGWRILSIWRNEWKQDIPHIPWSNLIIQNRVFQIMWPFPEVPGAEDVIYGMMINIAWVWIERSKKFTVFTDTRVSFRTPRWHGYGHRIWLQLQAINNIDAPYLQSQECILVIGIVATFLKNNAVNWGNLQIWTSRLMQLFQKYKVNVSEDVVKRWHSMLLELVDFSGKFFHPIVEKEVIHTIEATYPLISLREAAQKIIHSSKFLDSTTKNCLLKTIDNAVKKNMGHIAIRFIFLYIDIHKKIFEIGNKIESNIQWIISCKHVYNYEAYFALQHQAMQHMLSGVLAVYKVLLWFEYTQQVTSDYADIIVKLGTMEPDFFVSYLQITDTYLPSELSEIKKLYLELFELIRQLQVEL